MESRSAVEELLGNAESDLLGRCLAADTDGRPSASDVGQVLRTAAEVAEARTSPEAAEAPAAQTATPSVLAEGDRVDDRYEIVCELGRGATGITYLALDDLAEQEVVLKSILDRESVRTLSTNEYKRLYELRHPGLPRVDHVFPPGSPVHLKLEYIQGQTLEQADSDGSIDLALRVAREVGDVLRYLDERDLVHRDINPSNIIIPADSDRPAVLLDFGLAAPTSSETSVGTPRYRDPEIDRGQPWTPAADLYSLGCVLFELTTGRLPYSREPSMAEEEVVELSPAERARLGEPLATVLTRAVQPDPRQRYPSAAEFLADLVAEPAATGVPGGGPAVDADGRRIIAGRYVLLPETVVSGGAADVFRAIDLDAPGDPVAVKVIRNTPERDRLVDLFFKREFGSLQELHHPNVIQLLDGGFDEHSEEYFLTLEWMPTTLTSLMAERERIDWEWFSQAVALPLASALSAAHARQVIHRDVKPSNVLVTQDGVVKLADFGISVLKTSLPTDDRTLADQRSAPYSPPEREYASDATRDVYGYGVLVIECLSGRRIADYPEIQDALDGIVAPEPVFDLLRRCVSTDPDERPRNGLALEAMLQQAARPAAAEPGSLGRVYCQLSSNVLEEKLRVAATKSGSGTPIEFVRRDLSEDVYVRVAPRREGDDNKRRLYLCGQRWSYLAVVEVAPPRLALIHGRVEDAEQLDRDRERGALADHEFKVGQSADDHRSAEAAIQQLVDLAELKEAEIQEGRAERDERRLFAQWASLLNALWDIETKKEAETRYRNLTRQGNTVTCVLQNIPDEDLVGEDVVLVAGDTHGRSKRFRCVVTEIRGRTARLWLNGQPSEEPPSAGFLRTDISLTIKSLRRQRDALNAVRFGGANVRRDDLPSLLLEPASSQASIEVPVTRWLEPELDDSKRTAVQRALGTRDFLLVQGPPGTGKTTLIAELVGQELRQNPDCRILLTSQTHVALDNALEALERTLPSGVRLTRLASREGQVADATRHLLLERQAPSWRREVRQRSDSFIEEFCDAHGIRPEEVRSSVLLGNLRALRMAYDASESALDEARLQLERSDPDTSQDPEASVGIEDAIDAAEDSVERLKRQVAEVAAELGPLLGLPKTQVQSWSLAEIEAATQPAVLDDPVKGSLLKRLVSLQGSWLERVGRGEEFDEALLRASSVVAATCVGLAGPPAAQNLEFDVCIVDEASIATATQALVPFVRSKRWILVGDPNQLPPFQEHALTNPEYQEAFNLDQETLKTTMFDLLWSALPDMNKTVLTDQYRMTKPIGDLVSTVFYGGLLNSVRTGGLDGMQLALPKPATWLDTSGVGRHRERSAGKRHTSFDNPAEAEAVVNLLRRLEFVASASGRTEPMSVLVLAGYAAQVGLLRDQIATVHLEALRTETNTIDAAQGREADIVVLSVVRSNDRGVAGFLRERSRINVALSRARWGLVVVGDAAFCSQHEGPLQDVLAYMEAHPEDCVIEALTDA